MQLRIKHHSPSPPSLPSLSHQIHPIFILSLADLLLAMLWIVGGALWFRSAPDRSWCFAVSLLTVVCGPASLREYCWVQCSHVLGVCVLQILVCVTVNLTVVYAALMYSTLKKIYVFGMLVRLEGGRESEGRRK